MSDNKPLGCFQARDAVKAPPTMLTAETIQAADDRQIELVLVPEWAGAIYVKTLTGQERDKWEASCTRSGNRVDIRGLMVRLIIAAACDAEGNKLFDNSAELWLNKKSAKAIARIYDVAKRLSGLTTQDEEELVGNSESDQSGDSGSS